MPSDSLFWADKIARQVLERKKFHFLPDEIPEIKSPSVKSSSSLSGVLHIGRLSDIIRGEAAFRALAEHESRAKFIYVTEDMDPLRGIPEGIPQSFKEFIGFSVSDAPDPFGCHESYAWHFKEIFLKTFEEFLEFPPEVFSMRDEYRKGNFTKHILELVGHAAEVRGIVDKFKDNKSDAGWIPWKPICDKCGNMQTTNVLGVEGTKVRYECKDYAFEKLTAKGCGHVGVSDLNKANGKLAWKSEWASQWKRWNVVAEGAGKEYNAPNSAFFVNAEICERVLHYPMPVPVFYEHLLIDGQKMSASLGNVVFPHQWLEVARPETLKFLYLKRLEKTRSFSWLDVPNLELELDRAAEAFSSNVSADEKDGAQLKKLFLFSSVKGRKVLPLPADFALVSYLVQVLPDDESVLEKLRELGHVPGNSAEGLRQISERVAHCRRWVGLHVPAEEKIAFAETLAPELRKKMPAGLLPVFREFASEIVSGKSAEDLQKSFFDLAKSGGQSPKEAFEFAYLALIGRPKGPKIGSLVLGLGREKCAKRFKEL